MAITYDYILSYHSAGIQIREKPRGKVKTIHPRDWGCDFAKNSMICHTQQIGMVSAGFLSNLSNLNSWLKLFLKNKIGIVEGPSSGRSRVISYFGRKKQKFKSSHRVYVMFIKQTYLFIWNIFI